MALDAEADRSRFQYWYFSTPQFPYLKDRDSEPLTKQDCRNLSAGGAELWSFHSQDFALQSESVPHPDLSRLEPGRHNRFQYLIRRWQGQPALGPRSSITSRDAHICWIQR